MLEALKRRDKNPLSEGASEGRYFARALLTTTPPGFRHVVISHSCMNLSLTTIDHEYTNYLTAKVIILYLHRIFRFIDWTLLTKHKPSTGLAVSRATATAASKTRASSIIPATPPK
jgi:hypothetical protein